MSDNSLPPKAELVSKDNSLPPKAVLLPKDYVLERNEVRPCFGNLIATLPLLRKEYCISLEISFKVPNANKSNSPTSDEIKLNVIHLTLGKNFDDHSSIWLSTTGKLYVSANVNSKSDYEVTTLLTTPLTTGRFLVQIYQCFEDGKYMYSVDVNGSNINRVQNLEARDFKQVQVYLSNPWNKPSISLNISIKNLVITNGRIERLIEKEIPVSKGKLVAVLPKLFKQYLLSFEFNASDIDTRGNLMNITVGPDHKSSHDRNVVLGINYLKKGFLINASSFDFDIEISICNIDFERSCFHFEICQLMEGSDYILRIKVNEEMFFSEKNNNPRLFENVKIYASDPWNDVLPGTINNFFIVNGISSQ